MMSGKWESASADGPETISKSDRASLPPKAFARRKKSSLLKRARYLDARYKRNSMGLLKEAAYRRQLDDLDLPEHVDPQELACEDCHSANAFCCTVEQTAPPWKRRATDMEMDRVKRPKTANPHPTSDMDECCFKPCDSPDCEDAAVIPCVGDAHCPSKTACADPTCEGAPCFEPGCESPPCTDDACPDRTCPEGSLPNVDDLCQFDPWNCCDNIDSNIFNDPALWNDHWLSFHAAEHGDHHHVHPPPTLQQNTMFQPNYQTNQAGPAFFHDTSNLSPTLLNAAGSLTSLDSTFPVSQLSAAESLSYMQTDHSHGRLFNDQPLDYTYTGFHGGVPSQTQYAHARSPSTPFNQQFSPNIADSVYSRMSDPSLTPSSTLDGSIAVSREASETPFYPNVYSSAYGQMQGVTNSIALGSSRSQLAQNSTKSESGIDSDGTITCKWTVGGSFVCGQPCASSEDLQNHIRDDHVRLMKGELICQWQGCRNEGDFKQRSKLNRHVQTHAGYRPHVCPWEGCGQSFGTKQTMDNHLKTHEQVKPYKCKFCDVTATTPTQIKTHENSVHLGKKRFKCKFCDFACTDSSNLSKHEKTHRKRTFMCLHEGCSFKPDCRWENAKRHFVKSGHCPELLVKGSEAQEKYKREAMAAAAEGDDELMKSQLQSFLGS